MKKVLILLAAALFCNTAFAQNIGFEDGSVQGGPDYKVVDFDMLNTFGWGYHILQDCDQEYLDATTSFGRNREIFFNLGEITLRPVKAASVTLGVDLNWDNYRLKSDYFWLPDGAGKVSIANLDAHPEYSSIKKSVLRSFGFDVPLMLNMHLGHFKLSCGVVGEYNFPGRTKFVAYDNNGTKVKNGNMRVKDIESEPFTLSYRASASAYGFGLYFKYSPKSQFIPGAAPQFSYYTVGVILD